jgi:hypothetical protein
MMVCAMVGLATSGPGTVGRLVGIFGVVLVSGLVSFRVTLASLARAISELVVLLGSGFCELIACVAIFWVAIFCVETGAEVLVVPVVEVLAPALGGTVIDDNHRRFLLANGLSGNTR